MSEMHRVSHDRPMWEQPHNPWLITIVVTMATFMEAMDTSVAALTVSEVLPVIAPLVAEMVLLPTPAPVARPLALMVAADALEDIQVTLPVRLCVLLSL